MKVLSDCWGEGLPEDGQDRVERRQDEQSDKRVEEQHGTAMREHGVGHGEGGCCF